VSTIVVTSLMVHLQGIVFAVGEIRH